MLKIDGNNDIANLDSNSLIDYYRIALDFGMPAAIKAMEHLQNNNAADRFGSAPLSLLVQSNKHI